MERLSNRKEMDELQRRLAAGKDPERKRVYVCMGTGCKACGGDGVLLGFREALAHAGLEAEVDLVMTGCHGFCERGSLVLVQPEGILYTRT